MIRRTLLKHMLSLLVMAGLSIATPVLAEAPAALQAGKDYQPVRPPQPTESNDKIEVLEFFSFGCPHCNEFEPKFEAWVKALPKDVAVRKVPVSFGRDAWTLLGKVYLTLEVMGEADRLTPLVFHAVHEDHVEFGDEAQRANWLKKNGVDPAKFADTFKSFTVQTRMQHATQLAAAYQIQGVPTLAIDGKYIAAPSISGSFESALAVATQLTGASRAERKPAAAAPAPAASKPAAAAKKTKKHSQAQ